MDTIFINGLVFSGRHGVYEEERRAPQRFGVDIEVLQTPRDWQETLANTYDYMEARDIAQRIIEGPSCKLIETLAETIAQEILKNKNVAQVAVTLRKLDIVAPAEAGVTIVRT